MHKIILGIPNNLARYYLFNATIELSPFNHGECDGNAIARYLM